MAEKDLSKLSDAELDQIILQGTMQKKSDAELDQIIASGTREKSLPERAAGAVMSGLGKAAEFVDRYTGAPTRAAVYEATKPTSQFEGLEPLQKPGLFGRTMEGFRAFGKQFGEPAAKAPTGEMIARERIGVDDTARMKTPVYKSPGELSPDHWQKAIASGGQDKQKLGRWFDPNRVVVGWQEGPTKAEAAGVVLEMALDPTNAIAMGANAMAKIAGKGIQAGKRGLFGAQLGKLKPNAREIEMATRSLGGSPTAGQLFEGRGIQNLESAQAKSHGVVGGYNLRETIQANHEAAQKAAEAVVKDRSLKSTFQTGAEFEAKFNDELVKKLTPAEEIYQAWEGAFKQTSLPISNNRLVKKLKALKEEVKFSPEGLAEISRLEENIGKLENLDDLKRLRTTVRTTLQDRNLNPNVRYVLSEMAPSLTKARSDNLKLLAKDPQFAEFADEALKQISEADKVYAQTSEAVENALVKRGKAAQFGPKRAAKNFFEDTTEIQRLNKVLDAKDPAKIAKLAKDFPESFEILRQGKIEELVQKSEVAGRLDYAKFVRAADKLPPETKVLVFGKDANEKISNLKLFYESLPKDVNPSGTATTLQMMDILNPKAQIESLYRSGKLMMMTNAAKESALTKLGKSGLATPAVIGASTGLRLPAEKTNSLQIPKR